MYEQHISMLESTFAGFVNVAGMQSPDVQVKTRIQNSSNYELKEDEIFANLAFDCCDVYAGNEIWSPFIENFHQFSFRHGIDNIHLIKREKPNELKVVHLVRWILYGNQTGNC